ncbi:HET-domain-containing protein [Ustulina deusta]|nr:HET-domain-containing protein [Ustulina deusta]
MIDQMASKLPDNFCQRCLAIDLEDLLKEPREGPVEKEPAIILGKLSKEWESSPCPLCQFFLSIIGDRRDNTDPNVEYGVYRGIAAARGRKVYDGSLFFKTKLDIKAIGSPSDATRGFVNHSKLPELPSLLDHEKVDYEPIRTWCSRFYTPGKLRPDDVEDLPLLVIDCSTRKLVPTSRQCEYFALSYVWGPASAAAATAAAETTQGSSDDLPARLPATVEDAMKVVAELGFRYLWVDKYCLDQNNAAEFREQLQRMAGIYRNAVATIVAAAGSDAAYGLPGVGSRHRTKQPHVKVGDYALWSSMSDPRTTICDSVWITRAWTYQEGVCSANLIVFTDEQVYYQNPNIQLTHHDRGWRNSCEMFPDGGLGGSNGRLQLDGMLDMLETSPAGIHRHIERYVARNLSYQSDALNGMLGILKRCGNGPYPINHYYGVPILGPVDIHRLVSYRATDRSWPLTEAFLVGLFWVCEGLFDGVPGYRREGFPSWSWTGWRSPYEGPSHWLKQYGLYDCSEVHPELSVRPSDDLITWETYCSKEWHPSEDLHLGEQELYLEAPTKIVRIMRAPEDLEGGCCHGKTSNKQMKWVAIVGDDEANVLVQVQLTDGAIVSRVDAGETVSVNAIILRRLSLNSVDCSEQTGYSANKARYFVRACALLVSETDQGAIKAGTLELTPDSYRVRGRDAIVPPDSVSDEIADGEMACYECTAALKLIMQGARTETTKLV